MALDLQPGRALALAEELRSVELLLSRGRPTAVGTASPWVHGAESLTQYGSADCGQVVEVLASRLARQAMEAARTDGQDRLDALKFIGTAAPALDVDARHRIIDGTRQLLSSATSDPDADKTFLKACVWALGCVLEREALAARPPGVPASSRVLGGLEALHAALENAAGSSLAKYEAISAFRKVLAASRPAPGAKGASSTAFAGDVAAAAGGWVPLLLTYAVCEAERLRAVAIEALSDARPVVPSSPELSKAVHEAALSGALAGIERLLGEAGAVDAAVAAWDALAAFLRTDLLRPELCNPMLGLIGKAFGRGTVASRVAAYRAWRRVPDAIADGTVGRKESLVRPKYAQVVLKPLLHCLNAEPTQAIREECLATWGYILSLLDPTQLASGGTAPSEASELVEPVLSALLCPAKPDLYPRACVDLAAVLSPSSAVPAAALDRPRLERLVPLLLLEAAKGEGTWPREGAAAWTALVARLVPEARSDARADGARGLLRCFAEALGPAMAAASPDRVPALADCWAAVCERLGPSDLVSARFKMPLDLSEEGAAPPPATPTEQLAGPLAYVAAHWLRAAAACGAPARPVADAIERVIARAADVATHAPAVLRAAGPAAWRPLARLLQRSLAAAAGPGATFPAPPAPGPVARVPPASSCAPLIVELLLYPFRCAHPSDAEACRAWQADVPLWKSLYTSVCDFLAEKSPDPCAPLDDWAASLSGLLPRDPSEIPPEARLLLLPVLAHAADETDIDSEPPSVGRTRGRMPPPDAAEPLGFLLALLASGGSLAASCARAEGPPATAAKRFLDGYAGLLKRVRTPGHAQRAALELVQALSAGAPADAGPSPTHAPTQSGAPSTQATGPATQGGGPSQEPGEAVLARVDRVWAEALAALARGSGGAGWGRPAALRTLAPVLQAGFGSRRRSVRRSTLDFWSQTFGKERTLEYPAPLLPCLARIRAKAPGMRLPSWPEDAVADPAASQDSVPASQDNDDPPPRRPLVPLPPPPPASPSPSRPPTQRIRAGPACLLPPLRPFCRGAASARPVAQARNVRADRQRAEAPPPRAAHRTATGAGGPAAGGGTCNLLAAGRVPGPRRVHARRASRSGGARGCPAAAAAAAAAGTGARRGSRGRRGGAGGPMLRDHLTSRRAPPACRQRGGGGGPLPARQGPPRRLRRASRPRRRRGRGSGARRQPGTAVGRRACNKIPRSPLSAALSAVEAAEAAVTASLSALAPGDLAALQARAAALSAALGALNRRVVPGPSGEPAS